MQDGMLIHIPMSRKPININIHNMAKSEVYNTDCIEYMHTLPDNHFDIAVCDPPYGHGNDESLLGGGRGSDSGSSGISSNRFGGWFHRYFQPVEQAQREDGEKDTTSQRTHRFSGGTWAERYKIGGGRKQKPHNGTLHHHKSSLMSCSV